MQYARQELLDFKPIEKYNLHKIHLLDGPIEALVILINALIVINNKKLTVITGAESTVVPVPGENPTMSMVLKFYHGFDKSGSTYPIEDGLTFATAKDIRQHGDNPTIFRLITNRGETICYQTQGSQVVRLSPRI